MFYIEINLLYTGSKINSLSMTGTSAILPYKLNGVVLSLVIGCCYFYPQLACVPYDLPHSIVLSLCKRVPIYGQAAKARCNDG